MAGHDITRNEFMLTGSLAKCGYDWWWHSFTARHAVTGEEKPFFIEFFTCNPALGKDEPILGQLPENKAKGIRPSYLMVKVGTWGAEHFQLHKFVGWNNVKMHGKAPFWIKAENCFLSETETEGSVCITEAEEHPEWMCDNGEISWNLKIDKQIAFNVGYGASKPLREAKAFEMYWHAEGIKTQYSGTVICNGEEYVVTPETSYGYADKNWGRDFTSPWVWLASCNLTSRRTRKKLENTAFDIGGGCPKIYALALDRKLLGCICYEGRTYEFNFSKFWTMSKTEFAFRESIHKVYWKVRQETATNVMLTEIECKKENMLLINYEAPDGQKRHNRLWNGGNGKGRIRLYKKSSKGLILIDDMDAENVGCEYGEYDD